MAFRLPFDLLLLAMSNTLFLIYPVRFSQGTSADFQMVGRTMLFMLMHFLMLIPGLGIPAALAGLAYRAERIPSAGVCHHCMGVAGRRGAAVALCAPLRCSCGLIPAPRRRRRISSAATFQDADSREVTVQPPGSCRR